MASMHIRYLFLFMIIAVLTACEDDLDYRDKVLGIYQCACNHKGFYHNGVHPNNYIELQTIEEVFVEKTASDDDTLIVINPYGTVILDKDYTHYDDNRQGFKRDLSGKFFVDSDSISFGGYNFSAGYKVDSITFSRDHSYLCNGKKKK